MLTSKSSKYWVAGHITSFFYISDESHDLLEKGSQGAGFNIDQGVITEVSLNSSEPSEIYFNGVRQKSGKAVVSESVLEIIENNFGFKLPKLKIKHDFQIPLNSGFGASAAGALGLVYSLDKLLMIGLTDRQKWQIAHSSEIINKTGLGDILGLFSNSTFEIRLKEGAPGIGQVQSLNFDVENYELFTLTKGELSTKHVLSNPESRARIKDCGLIALKKIKVDPSFQTFMNVSIRFSQELNLLSGELKLLKNKLEKNFLVSQIMLGNSLFIFVPKENMLNFLKDHASEGWVERKLTNITLKEIF